MPRRHACSFLAVAVCFTFSNAAWAGNSTLRLQIQGETVEGMPLHWTNQRLQLLGRDGYWRDLSINAPESAKKASSTFAPYSQSEMRGMLMHEFGKRFQISGTGHYLVVHPEGERDLWAPRFEEIYRSFSNYFSVRGVSLRPVQFPLVAIVLPNHQEFQRYAVREGFKVDATVLGYYSLKSNRIVVFDATAGQGDNVDWSINADTIIHEVAHQIAYNTGLHNRFAQCPVWIVEGLGTLFEARGIWNARYHTRPSDRINRGRLERFKEHAATTRKKGSLAKFVSSDRVFHSNQEVGYAEAWAFTLFLVETYPRKYLDLLTKTARKPNFVDYTEQDRLKDFTDIFGKDLGMLEARFLRFTSTLK